MFIFTKPKVYLKTYIYSGHEIKFLKLNFSESFNFIDHFIICEFNRTHLGTNRDFIFPQFLGEFSKEEQNKLIYLPCDLSNQVFLSSDSEQVHRNENLMRGYFTSQIDLNPNDVVISVDADEIIYSRYYESLINKISLFTPALQLKLHQFFYRINYLWTNETFIAPTIARASFYKDRYPGQWRYDGNIYPEIVGGHFSWCLTVDEMLTKLNVYSHHYDYSHLAKREVLEDAIRKKKYPFDPDRNFEIRELDIEKERNYYPEMIYSMLAEFKDLMA